MSARGPSVDCLGTRFQNPILLAAGTAGFGREVAGVIDLSALGGLVTKAVSPEPRHGNPAPRVAETRGAMLNSVGLANPGLEAVRREQIGQCRGTHAHAHTARWEGGAVPRFDDRLIERAA